MQFSILKGLLYFTIQNGTNTYKMINIRKIIGKVMLYNVSGNLHCVFSGLFQIYNVYVGFLLTCIQFETLSIHHNFVSLQRYHLYFIIRLHIRLGNPFYNSGSGNTYNVCSKSIGISSINRKLPYILISI